MQVMFESPVFLERYFTEHQKVASVANFRKKIVQIIKQPLGIDPKSVVFPSGLSYTLFARDIIKTIKGQIFITCRSDNITRPYKQAIFSHSMNYALGHGAFKKIEK